MFCLFFLRAHLRIFIIIIYISLPIFWRGDRKPITARDFNLKNNVLFVVVSFCVVWCFFHRICRADFLGMSAFYWKEFNLFIICILERKFVSKIWANISLKYTPGLFSQIQSIFSLVLSNYKQKRRAFFGYIF